MAIAPRAFGHFPGHGFADRAVLGERFGAHAEKLLFGFVSVSDEAGGKYCRSPRHIRHPVRDVSARAGLGDRERFFAGR